MTVYTYGCHLATTTRDIGHDPGALRNSPRKIDFKPHHPVIIIIIIDISIIILFLWDCEMFFFYGNPDHLEESSL